ncbi:hypothetical protein ATO6_14310 [Oceanicola sp. 22II-s10i]|uniref:Zn-ribbon domain-containing OB-fold protein n=1 Tax=Oceanicola sp. 22II-s10i TaxID=1317116 RepID=UPI000B5214CC|nr:OB-fold domain-containing protein [Oceanicola sp. 22II-s10i]OWU84213.1 hypothetical protein ATO6_14310 [Oceanicola sp. 22II-s10i]
MNDQADLWAPMPHPTGFSATFWDHADKGELALPKCEACDALHYPPRRFCPECGGDALTWTAMSGRATVVSHSTVLTSFHGQDWVGQLPYVVVLVDLDEGPRMLSRLVGSDTIARGDRVHVTFAEVQGRRLPYFTPEGAA